jgi:hypothetical protein
MFPWRVDGQRAAQQPAFSSLKFLINRFFNNDRGRHYWGLGCLPLLNFTINSWSKSGIKFVILRPLVQIIRPVFIAKTKKPGGICASYFFGKRTFRALRINCTQEFSLIGRIPMISEPAAMMMLTTATVVGSIGTFKNLLKS